MRPGPQPTSMQVPPRGSAPSRSKSPCELLPAPRRDRRRRRPGRTRARPTSLASSFGERIHRVVSSSTSCSRSSFARVVRTRSRSPRGSRTTPRVRSSTAFSRARSKTRSSTRGSCRTARSWCERRATAAIERLRFVLALDDDHTEFLRRFADDPLLGETIRQASRHFGRCAFRPSPVRCCARSVAS